MRELSLAEYSVATALPATKWRLRDRRKSEGAVSKVDTKEGKIPLTQS